MKKYACIALSAVAALAMAACSSKDTTNATAKPAVTAAQPFGPGCATMPTDPSNPGSLDAMSKAPVATAAAGNPDLSTLVTAVNAAGLTDTMNTQPELTVFAPNNAAFAKIPAATMSSVMADKAQLTKILTYHIVPGTITPDQLAGTHKTVEGGDLTITGSGTNFTVNGTAMIVCGDIQTANATVYIVNGVLTPTN